MARPEYRVRAGDPDFGHTCPECASPKSLQARRCADCYRDWLRNGGAHCGPANPAWKGGLPYVRPSRAKGGSSVPAADHPWRVQEHAGAVAHRARQAA